MCIRDSTETARKLHREDGISTVEQLRRLAERQPTKLTPHQHIGLKFYEEFKERIPRDEVEALAGHVEDAVNAVCPGASVTVAGSYRRGKASCGDVDILLCPSEDFVKLGSQGARGALVDTVEEILPAVLARLRARGVVTDDLSMGSVSWMGVARLPGESIERSAPTDDSEAADAVAVVPRRRVHRRVDIKHCGIRKGIKLASRDVWRGLDHAPHPTDVEMIHQPLPQQQTFCINKEPVSYTHLTLPTILRV